MYWYLQALKQYAVFRGRSHRPEFWYFVLFNIIISLVLMMVDNILGTFDPESNAGLLNGLYTLAVLIPSIAVMVRRLHDSGRSGWWVLIGLVPLIGFVVLLIFAVLAGTPGPNQYGPDPRTRAATV